MAFGRVAVSMTIVTATVTDDEVFRAFVLGGEMRGDTVRADSVSAYGPRMPGPGVSVLYSHDVLIAVRSEECIVFDAAPRGTDCRCVCRVMAHVGRAGVHAHEHYADDEVSVLDHGAFVALATRLGAI